MIYSIAEIKKLAIPCMTKHNVFQARLSGDYALGIATEDSLIEFLVDSSNIPTLLQRIALELALEEVFSKKIRTITFEAHHEIQTDPLRKHLIIPAEKQIDIFA